MLKDTVYKTPESCGVSSKSILRFIKFIEENKINLHSFMMIKDGAIIAEGYFPPFNENFLHRLYSCTKTYVAIAVGMLYTEGRVKLNDRIIDFFPEYDTPDVDDMMRECTLEDALMMSTPKIAARMRDPKAARAENPYSGASGKPAGMLFEYFDGAEMATRVVERVSGQYLTDYLRPLFDRLGISEDVWCVKDLDGAAWGGSGMLSTMRDFAKFAEFVHKRGAIDGEQLIAPDYMDRMTSRRSESNVAKNAYSPLVSGGYGYLTWITPDAVCLRGMGCQEAYCFREKDFIFVCNGDTMTDNDCSDIRIYDALKYMIYENIGEPTADTEYSDLLAEKLKNLSLPTYGTPHSETEHHIDGVTYTLEKNEMGWSEVRLSFAGEQGSLGYIGPRGAKEIKFSLGEYLSTIFPETHYYDSQRGGPSGRCLDCLTIGEWIEERKLLLRIYITDVSFGSIFALFSFKEDKIAMKLARRGEFILDDYGGWAIGVAE